MRFIKCICSTIAICYSMSVMACDSSSFSSLSADHSKEAIHARCTSLNQETRHNIEKPTDDSDDEFISSLLPGELPSKDDPSMEAIWVKCAMLGNRIESLYIDDVDDVKAMLRNLYTRLKRDGRKPTQEDLDEVSVYFDAAKNIVDEINGLGQEIGVLILAREVALNRKLGNLTNRLISRGRLNEESSSIVEFNIMDDMFTALWPFPLDKESFKDDSYWRKLGPSVDNFAIAHRKLFSIANNDTIDPAMSGYVMLEALRNVWKKSDTKKVFKAKWYNKDRWTENGVKPELWEEFVTDIKALREEAKKEKIAIRARLEAEEKKNDEEIRKKVLEETKMIEEQEETKAKETEESKKFLDASDSDSVEE
ncbi:MAG: hypothetical protein IJ730_03230 [Alphaproteobacteria bacterium]|nr:hypothetical protein [Alphaproteobacteria bacterium]